MSQKLSLEERKKLFGGRATPPYKLGELRDCKGDLSKRWTVEFWVWNQNLNNGKGGLHRKQKKIPLKLNAKERREFAQEFIFDINKDLILGYHIKLKGNKDPITEAEHARKDISLVDALNLILKIKKPLLKENSFKDYRLEAEKFIDWIEENYPDIMLVELTKEMFISFLDYEQIEKGISNRTRNNKLIAIRTLINDLKYRGYIEENPLNGIKKERIIQPQNFPFNKWQKDKLKEAMKAKDMQLYYACSFLYHLFIRPSELRALKVEQIQFSQEQVMIPNNHKSGRAKYPTISEAFDIILRQMDLENCNPSWYVFGREGVPGPLPLSKKSLAERFRQIRIDCGLEEKYTFYCWKHTGNLDSVLAGINIKAIQKQNGHADLKDTDVYLRSIGYEHNEQIRSRQPDF